jgi:hypothetical protein
MENINIDWQGPFSREQALQFQANTDYGLYQYYGEHPIYGQNALLYIGSATKQTFGNRLSQHNWHLWSATSVEIYVGRLCAEKQIDPTIAQQKLLLAESILLFSHSPAFNTSNLNSIRPHGDDDVRVLNWGKRKSLFPEVSISRWESGLTVGHAAPKSLGHVHYG